MTRPNDVFYGVKDAIVGRLRIGNRLILWTPDHGLGFGNFLYLWMHAHVRQAAGDDYRVLVTEPMRPWVDRFPDVEPLVLASTDVRVIDKREWGTTSRLYQRFGIDFTREQLQSFIRERLVSAPVMADLPQVDVVLNVRRGDYYSRPDFRERYGLDIRAYAHAALAAAGDVVRVAVVSDDPEWCRANLDLPSPTFLPPDPVEHFRAVCGARTLIGTNSTFSYWGGYVGDVLHGQRRVVMPAFHARSLPGGLADQLDSRWTTVPQ